MQLTENHHLCQDLDQLAGKTIIFTDCLEYNGKVSHLATLTIKQPKISTVSHWSISLFSIIAWKAIALETDKPWRGLSYKHNRVHVGNFEKTPPTGTKVLFSGRGFNFFFTS